MKEEFFMRSRSRDLCNDELIKYLIEMSILTVEIREIPEDDYNTYYLYSCILPRLQKEGVGI